MSSSATTQRPPTEGSGLSLSELAIVVLLGIVLGAAFETIRPNFARDSKPAGAPVAQQPEGSTVYDLPPIVTNLGSPQETWIRLEGSIIFDPRKLPHPEALAGEIGDDILAYLRTVTLKELEGPIGLQNVREDLKERAATRTGGMVREFVIRTLVVQ